MRESSRWPGSEVLRRPPTARRHWRSPARRRRTSSSLDLMIPNVEAGGRSARSSQLTTGTAWASSSFSWTARATTNDRRRAGSSLACRRLRAEAASAHSAHARTAGVRRALLAREGADESSHDARLRRTRGPRTSRGIKDRCRGRRAAMQHDPERLKASVSRHGKRRGFSSLLAVVDRCLSWAAAFLAPALISSLAAYLLDLPRGYGSRAFSAQPRCRFSPRTSAQRTAGLHRDSAGDALGSRLLSLRRPGSRLSIPCKQEYQVAGVGLLSP